MMTTNDNDNDNTPGKVGLTLAWSEETSGNWWLLEMPAIADETPTWAAFVHESHLEPLAQALVDALEQIRQRQRQVKAS